MARNRQSSRPHTWLKLPGKISISRPMNHHPATVSIRIDDDLSHCVAVEVAMPLADFADALFGHGHVDCTLGVNVSGALGKRSEVKTIDIATPRELLWKSSQRDEIEVKLDALVQPHEVDGWVADLGNFFNHHCYGDRSAGHEDHVDVSVVFRRHVELTPEETAASLEGLLPL